MLRLFFCLSLISVHLVVISQESNELQGIIYSGETLKPLSDATVRIGNYNQKTDFQGRFAVKIKANETLIISHSKYHGQTVPFGEYTVEEPFQTYLTPSAYVSSELMESSETQAIYKPELEQIFGYTFMGDTLVVASHPQLELNSIKKSESSDVAALTLIVRGVIVSKYILKESVLEFHFGCGSKMYLVGRDTAWILAERVQKDAFQAIPIDDYYKYIFPCFHTNPSHSYNITPYPIIPKADITRFDKTSQKYELIRSIENRAYFEKIEDDYTMLVPGQRQEAAILSEETGIAAKVFAPYLRRFYIDRDIRVPYIEGFQRGDTLFIFDNANHQLFGHSLGGDELFVRNIYHTNLTREDLEDLVIDPETGVFYAVHNRAGVMVVRRIDSRTGASGKPFKVHYPFPKNIQVHEGYVYYLYKSIEKGTYYGLVREKLGRQ